MKHLDGLMTRLLRRLWVLVLMVGLIAGCLPSLHSVPLAVSPVARPSTVQVNLQLDLPRRIQSLPAAWDEIMLSVTASGSGPLSQTKAANAAQIFTFQLVPGPATVSCELHNQGSVVARGSTTATLAAGNNPVRIALQAFSPFVSSLGTTVVTPNSTLTLEGNFPGASTTVTFQGGASAIATPLGPNRVQVTIPANAQSGPMTVTSSGSSTVAPPGAGCHLRIGGSSLPGDL